MATYFGETMAKVLGGGDGKAAAADFGGKLRVVNERVPLVNGFASNDAIVVAQVPQGARILNIQMQVDADLESGILFSLGNNAGDPEKYGVDLDFAPGGQFFGYQLQSVATVNQLGKPLPAAETILLTVTGSDVPPNPWEGSLRVLTTYALD